MIHHHAPTAAVAPLAIDDRAIVGRHHRRVGRDSVVGPAVAVVSVAGGPVEPDHDSVLLARRVVVIHPGGDARVGVGERQRQVARRQGRLGRRQGDQEGDGHGTVDP